MHTLEILSILFYSADMKLSEWAKRQGIAYKTAHRWFHRGVLPVKARQLATGTILVEDEGSDRPSGVALYARVSTFDQKKDLERQVARLIQFATTNKLAVTKTITEVGSGLNGRRSKLLRLLKDRTVGTIVVENRERLTRFGTEYIEAALSTSGRKLVVAEEGELKEDLPKDLMDALMSFCARLYGKRSAKKRVRRAMQVIEEG